MMHICTHCDKKYLRQGLALRKSLIDTGEPFLLYWLALDAETFDTIKDLRHVIAFDLRELEGKELSQARNNPLSQYGDAWSNFVWTLTPYFTWFILGCIPENEYLIYCDADIYFYKSPQGILEKIGERSIGLHSHGSKDYKDSPVGEFNCGVVVFKKDSIGMMAAEAWKNWLLNPNNEYKEYGTCGDQKYLELFPKLFKEVCIFDREGINYAAPWNINNNELDFFHFSHFSIENGSYKDSYHGEWNPASNPSIKPNYDKYFEVIKSL